MTTSVILPSQGEEVSVGEGLGRGGGGGGGRSSHSFIHTTSFSFTLLTGSASLLFNGSVLFLSMCSLFVVMDEVEEFIKESFVLVVLDVDSVRFFFLLASRLAIRDSDDMLESCKLSTF